VVYYGQVSNPATKGTTTKEYNMTPQQEHSTATPTTTPDAPRPEWEVWLYILAPRRATMLIDRCDWDPYPPDWPHMKLFWRSVADAIARVPEGLVLATDEDGLPIIACEALFGVVVLAPDGTKRVVEYGTTEVPHVIGWKTLEEFQARQRKGEGLLEKWRNPESTEDLSLWSWNEGVELEAEDEYGLDWERNED
jgi:hypothetical protein